MKDNMIDRSMAEEILLRYAEETANCGEERTADGITLAADFLKNVPAITYREKVIEELRYNYECAEVKAESQDDEKLKLYWKGKMRGYEHAIDIIEKAVITDAP